MYTLIPFIKLAERTREIISGDEDGKYEMVRRRNEVTSKSSLCQASLNIANVRCDIYNDDEKVGNV